MLNCEEAIIHGDGDGVIANCNVAPYPYISFP